MSTATPDAPAVHPSVSRPPIDIVLLGLGQVGAAVARAALDARPHSSRLRIAGALVRDTAKARDVQLPGSSTLTVDAEALFARRPDVIVELLGGLEPAFALVSRALERGIPVVTANKSLLAARGPELDALAARTGTPLLYEASVLAGVPFLGALSHRPMASHVTRISGIVNGTSNFILSVMHATGGEWTEALADAQRRGLAEPDPRNDVLGIDAAEKLSVLLQHFGWGHARAEDIETTGIEDLRPGDIAAAAEFGGVIKPVIVAERRAHDTTAFVGPAFVPAGAPLAGVRGADNAITLRNGYGELFYGGPGAGPEATAATVLDDVRELTERRQRTLPREARVRTPLLPDAPETSWFVRITSTSRLPAPEAIADLLGSHGIWLRRTSLYAASAEGEAVWALTWRASRFTLERAIAALCSASGCEASAIRALEA